MVTGFDRSDSITLPPVVSRAIRTRNIVVGLAILVPMVLLVLIGPELTPHSVRGTNAIDRYLDPNPTYWLGTDHHGRDLLTRTLAGGRISLLMGVSAVGMALALGVPIGLYSGYKGSQIDEVTMRGMDILMSFPTIILALLIIAGLGTSLWNAVLAVGIVYTPRIARVVRGETISLVNEEFIDAARVRDESDTYIIFREILPNITGPIIVEASIRVGYAILILASLSFLGLGAQPPTPDWGYMVAEARGHMYQTTWFLLAPSVAITLTIVGLNVLGDGLRDLLDVKHTT